MSELANALRAEIDNQGISDSDAASRIGIGSSHLSQILRGSRPSVNDETLAKLVNHISADGAAQARVLEAYYKDRALPQFKNWIHVSAPGRAREDPPEGDAIQKLEALLRAIALPTKTVESLLSIVSALPAYNHLHELVNELAAFTREALPHANNHHRVFEETLSPKQIAEKKGADEGKQSVRYSKPAHRKRGK